MGRRSSQPQVNNVTQNTAPWAGQQGYLTGGFANASGLHSSPMSFFPGQTYANFDPLETEAMERGATRAREGSPSTAAARDYAMGILSGDPETLRATLGPKVGELLPALQSQFNRAGMGNSSLGRFAEQELVARELGRLRESAADRLERLGPQEYNDIARLAAIGETRRDMAEQGINEARDRYEFAQNEPWERLNRYMNVIQGNYGSSGNTNETRRPIPGSRLSGILGGGLGGAQLGGMFGPWGAGIGGILGGLGGLF